MTSLCHDLDECLLHLDNLNIVFVSYDWPNLVSEMLKNTQVINESSAIRYNVVWLKKIISKVKQ